jgi:hypothetical protein
MRWPPASKEGPSSVHPTSGLTPSGVAYRQPALGPACVGSFTLRGRSESRPRASRQLRPPAHKRPGAVRVTKKRRLLALQHSSGAEVSAEGINLRQPGSLSHLTAPGVLRRAAVTACLPGPTGGRDGSCKGEIQTRQGAVAPWYLKRESSEGRAATGKHCFCID